METISAAGAHAVRMKPPFWVKFSCFVATMAWAAAAALAVLAAAHWRWLRDETLTELLAWGFASLSAAFAMTWLLTRFKLLHPFFGLDRAAKKNPYRGIYGLRRLALLVGIVAPFAAAAALIATLHRTAPIPSSVTTSEEMAPELKGQPFDFWEYALFITPELLARHEVLIPYEKGPPEKLLSRVLLVDKATHAMALELHGKRPRSYADHVVGAVFEAAVRVPTVYGLWEYMPELTRFVREAGLAGLHRPVLTRTLLSTPGDGGVTVETIGTPLTEGSPQLRFFYRGAGGSVFQVRCDGCAFSRTLRSARMSADPRASLRDRKAWAQGRIKGKLRELAAMGPGAPAEKRELAKTELTLMLASLLTLDPRDPEAYFHLGKLAANRETLHSALRYGRDVGLEPAKLAELQSELDNR